MRVAVLALQGAFIEHEQMLRRLGCEVFEVRKLSDWLQPKDALVIPGGESTTMMHLLKAENLFDPIREAILSGLPVMGTCAGLILLSHDRLGTMDIEVRRNAYGRQLGSFVTRGEVLGVASDFEMVFIRAPYITHASDAVTVLARVDGKIVAARQGKQFVCAFHPELTSDTRWHEAFLKTI